MRRRGRDDPRPLRRRRAGRRAAARRVRAVACAGHEHAGRGADAALRAGGSGSRRSGGCRVDRARHDRPGVERRSGDAARLSVRRRGAAGQSVSAGVGAAEPLRAAPVRRPGRGADGGAAVRTPFHRTRAGGEWRPGGTGRHRHRRAGHRRGAVCDRRRRRAQRGAGSRRNPDGRPGRPCRLRAGGVRGVPRRGGRRPASCAVRAPASRRGGCGAGASRPRGSLEPVAGATRTARRGWTTSTTMPSSP